MRNVLAFLPLVAWVTLLWWLKGTRSGQRFAHDRLGWHDGHGTRQGFDGASPTGRCSQCGKRVLMDSQGNWFTTKATDA